MPSRLTLDLLPAHAEPRQRADIRHRLVIPRITPDPFRHQRALGGIETARQSIPEQDLRTSFFSSMRSYYDLAIDILEALERAGGMQRIWGLPKVC